MKSFNRYLEEMDDIDLDTDLKTATFKELSQTLQHLKEKGDTIRAAQVEKALEKKLEKHKYWR
jgi:hypothetical protein